MTRFISHARTLSELRDEFISDIARTVKSLQAEQAGVGALRSRELAKAVRVLESLSEFWQAVEVHPSRHKRTN